jgi:hypothetical protein
MTPLYVDRSFASVDELCALLARDYWHRGPVVFRNHGLGEVFGGAAEVLSGLRNMRRVASNPRVYADGRWAPAQEQHHCRQSDESIRHYIERLAREHAVDELLVVTDEFERTDERIWFRCARFLAGLYGAIGMPPGPAQVNLFAGAYRRTPFKFHKDVGDSITYAVSGRKRYLIWDYDEVAKHLSLPAGARHENMFYEHYDHRKLLPYATVLDTQPGDIFYWPWDCFHLAEPEGGEFSVSISFGVVPFAAPLSTMKSVLERTRHAVRPDAFVVGEQADPAAVTVAATRAALDDEEVLAALAEEQLFRRTRLGFKRALPLAAVDVEIDEHTWLVTPAVGMLAWTRHGEGWVVSANGHGFALDDHPKLATLLEELSSGVGVQVGDLRARYCEADGIDAHDLDDVLACLIRFRALSRAPDVVAFRGLFPLGLEDGGDTVLFGEVTKEDHRRISGFRTRARRVALADLVEIHEREQPRGAAPRYLFTAGYVGSTLLCECIDRIDGCFAIHEPRVLSDWSVHYGSLENAEARSDWRRMLHVITTLSFRADPGIRPVVKVGPYVQEVMPELLDDESRARGVHLYVALPRFLASIAKDPRRRADLRDSAASMERRRMIERIGGPVSDVVEISDLQAAAYVWLTDSWLHRSIAASSCGVRLRSLDFDRFLESPAAGLRALSDHLELGLAHGAEDTIASSDVLRRHAKSAGAQSYARGDREAALAASATKHRAEIDAALAWLEELVGCTIPTFDDDLLADMRAPAHGKDTTMPDVGIAMQGG